MPGTVGAAHGGRCGNAGATRRVEARGPAAAARPRRAPEPLISRAMPQMHLDATLYATSFVTVSWVRSGVS